MDPWARMPQRRQARGRQARGVRSVAHRRRRGSEPHSGREPEPAHRVPGTQTGLPPIHAGQFTILRRKPWPHGVSWRSPPSWWPPSHPHAAEMERGPRFSCLGPSPSAPTPPQFQLPSRAIHSMAGRFPARSPTPGPRRRTPRSSLSGSPTGLWSPVGPVPGRDSRWGRAFEPQRSRSTRPL